MNNNLVSIITVNYYSENQILNSLQSIQRYNTLDIEYIIVSNSPLDKEFKKKLTSFLFPVIIHENKNNNGFASGCNFGATLASGNFLFFLNPDTLFLNDVLKELIKVFSISTEIGITGPKTYKNTKEKISGTVKEHLSVTHFYNLMVPFLGFFVSPENIGGHYAPVNSAIVPVLNGHALLMQASVFKKIGGMDEKFFMYWEENDLCLRLQESGYKVFYCVDGEIMHFKGLSTNPYFFEMELEKHRSQKLFVLKHYPRWSSLNRISGVIGYSWRALLSLFTFNPKKIRQHWEIFTWYCFKYD